jgi:uncharacterized protein (DUF924 family)
MSSDAQAVIDFWFEALTPAQWFKKDAELDRTISKRFGALHAQAARCECYAWRQTAQGRLAEIIVLDQFSRNIHRDDARAFATDALALALAQEAVGAGSDAELTSVQRAFLYMPYMHSESVAIHELAMQLFDQPGLENNYDFEVRHKAIIDRFGRYPHRNAFLGRASTDEELAFLKEPGSSF